MKHSKAVILSFSAATAVWLLGPAYAQEPPSASGARNPEWILKTFDDSSSTVKLSEQEEREHQQRIRRLYDLQKESAEQASVSSEPAGAEAPRAFAAAPTSRPTTDLPPQANQAPPTTAPSGGQTTERLIEAVEALQMEIRQLRSDLAHQHHGALPEEIQPGTENGAGIEGPSTQENPDTGIR